jgi:hypothetical protein
MALKEIQSLEGRQTWTQLHAWAQLHVALLGAATLSLAPSTGVHLPADYRAHPSSGAALGVLVPNGSYQSLAVIPESIAQRSYVPRTELGKRLLALREEAIANGLPLLTVAEIRNEMARRRGEKL